MDCIGDDYHRVQEAVTEHAKLKRHRDADFDTCRGRKLRTRADIDKAVLSLLAEIAVKDSPYALVNFKRWQKEAKILIANLEES